MSESNENQPSDSTKPDNGTGVDCRPMSCSAADLLRAEAERLGGVRTERPIKDDLQWVYSVAAAWLDCLNDPARLDRWMIVPKDHQIANLINEISNDIKPLTKNQSIRERVANPIKRFFSQNAKDMPSAGGEPPTTQTTD